MVLPLDSDVKRLRILIGLLKNAEDPVVLAVAAHDLGQYVKHYDRGKRYVFCFTPLN
jgi:V-type H+-transporting ATPase subunit H